MKFFDLVCLRHVVVSFFWGVGRGFERSCQEGQELAWMKSKSDVSFCLKNKDL